PVPARRSARGRGTRARGTGRTRCARDRVGREASASARRRDRGGNRAGRRRHAKNPHTLNPMHSRLAVAALIVVALPSAARAADKLIDQRGDAAFVRDPAFDALGDELVGSAGRVEIELVLEIAVAAPAAHRADRTHAPVLLEAAALIKNELAGTLIGSREQ